MRTVAGKAHFADRVARFTASDRAFLAVATLLFALGAAATIAGASSMSAMDGMPMPGAVYRGPLTGVSPRV